jgi:hypothetical protein
MTTADYITIGLIVAGMIGSLVAYITAKKLPDFPELQFELSSVMPMCAPCQCTNVEGSLSVLDQRGG